MHWVAGTGDGIQYSVSAGDLSARPDLAGFLNLIHPNKVQVLGETEIRYLDSLNATDLASTLQRILESKPISLVIGDGLDVPPSIIA